MRSATTDHQIFLPDTTNCAVGIPTCLVCKFSHLAKSSCEVMKIQVESYCGYKVNERPNKFWIGDSAFFVESIEHQWRGVDAVYFRIHAKDGNRYILRYTESTDLWTLEQSTDRRQNPINKT